jgi:hypothetical protein
MVSVERPKTKEKFGSRERIRKWKTGITKLEKNLYPVDSAIRPSYNRPHAVYEL